ncbi:G-protein coupled receptor family C group 5 member D-like [Pleurodeles waltl]
MVCPDSYYPIFQFLCDEQAAWGIVLESLAGAGIVVTLILILVLLFMTLRVTDCAKRALIPIQLLFLLGTLGIFGLTFAFIVRLTAQTCPTRFFLFGVLFALCFACLLVHACKLVRLVRGGLGISGWWMLLIVIILWLVQCVIAILYVVLVIVKGNKPCVYTADAGTLDDYNKDFVMVLIYVMALMAVTFLISLFTLCGSTSCWKRHGTHIYVTMFFSIAIWVVWIVMLLTGNQSLGHQHTWDDPTLGIALVANGWVFLILYIIPEMCLMTRCVSATPKSCGQSGQNQPRLLRQSYGVENRVFAQDDANQGCDSGRSSPSSPPRFVDTLPMKEFDTSKEFSIPRPQQRDWAQYRTHHLPQQ